MPSQRSSARWRFLHAPPRSGAENMARDAALLARAGRTGESVFSIYSWERPTLSFGRNQRADGLYDRERLDVRRLDVVRRPTGGRAILHDREITYSVAAPLRESESLRAAYQRVNLLLLDGLARMGVSASISRGGNAPAPGHSPCFEIPSDGEIIAGGRKLVGSAQWRGSSAFLQHGSILVDDDQTSLAELSPKEIASAPVPAPATLRALLGRAPQPAEMASAMFEAVAASEKSAGSPLDESEVRPAALELLPEYQNEKWTWRR